MKMHWAAAAAIVTLALSLQITATIQIGGTPLRASAADLVLPLGLLGVFAYLLAMAPAANRWAGVLATLTFWRVPWPVLLGTAIATVVILCIAAVVGKGTTGTISQWAVVNKLLGWIALLAFAVAGYVMVRVGGAEHQRLFLKSFLRFAFVVATATYLAHLAQTFGYTTAPFFISNDTRVGGLMSNPTAFSFLCAVAVVLHLTDMRAQQFWSRRWHIAAVAVYLVLIVLAGSRSAWLGLAFGIAALGYLRQIHWRPTIAALAAALPLMVIALNSRDIADVVAPDADRRTMVYVLDHDLLSARQQGVEFRLDQLQRSLTLWRDKPWLGIGLGSYIRDDAARGHSPPQHIHNSALWLLTETGVIGAALFGAFFIVLIWGLWPYPGSTPFGVAAFAVLMVFVGVSIGTEALYQRHLWVLLGMALALPRPLDRSAAP